MNRGYYDPSHFKTRNYASHIMRSTTIMTFTLASLAMLLPLEAQDNNQAKKTPTQVTTRPANATPEWLKKLSIEQQRQIQSLLRDAATYLNGIRVQEAFEKIIEAELMAPEYWAIHNLKGAAYTKIREFDKATIAFTRALELAPGSLSCRFNLIEMKFCKGNFVDAEREFRQLMGESTLTDENKHLIHFKLLICRLKQNDEPAAKQILNDWDYLDDYPGFYFGNAAIHFSKAEDKEARKWLTAAKKIYNPALISLYTDSLIESGWIENFE